MPIEIIYDVEIYPNKLCLSFLKKNKMYTIDNFSYFKNLPLNDDKYLWVGFNNRRYDHPILEALKRGANQKDIFEMSHQTIHQNADNISWATNIVDLFEICPKISKCSLKEMGHRLKYPTLENLPYPFDQDLTESEWSNVKAYNRKDVEITAILWEKLRSEYKARQSLSLFFDIKTEFGGSPRLAEKAILSELDGVPVDLTQRMYKMSNLKLSQSSQTLYDAVFDISCEEYLKNKPLFMKKKFSINGCTVQFGIGGLHGLRKEGVYNNVHDYDVSSYYPSIILNCKLGSAQFRKIYQRIYDTRLKLKAENDPQADSLKLVLNSISGKFSAKTTNPLIYAPNIALSICLLGQFYLIDLIEKLKPDTCVYANTDGIMTKNPIPDDILVEWQTRTGFTLKHLKYKTLILKDVNSYYACTEDGMAKRKKEFNLSLWTHNSKAQIIQKAVLNYLLNGVAVETTVKSETEIYNFCFFAKVTRGSAKKLLLDGEPMTDPKIRYYISTKGHILERLSDKRRANGSFVQSRVCKDSPIQLAMNLKPISNYPDINYEWYICKCKKLIVKLK